MLYHLLLPLQDWFSPMRVFQYITFRGALAIVVALFLSLLLGNAFIRWLHRVNAGQYIREEGLESHHAKSGTPTMGGVLILFALTVSTILTIRWDKPFFWVLLLATLGFGAVGFIDDYLKIRRKHNLGLRAYQKFLLQVLIALAVAAFLFRYAGTGSFDTTLTVPFFKAFHPDMGILFIPFAAVVIVGCSNAVNFTDGLDGLAIGSCLIAAGTSAILSYAAGHALIADYLGIPNVKGTGELSVFAAALVGTCLGFLWFNAHPARVFMGDVGSLSLGAAIGTMAVMIKQEILLVIVGGLFVMEALSVILQVASYKFKGKRIFLMAPIHHHFEKKGWAETHVVVRFWILAILFSLTGLATLKIR